MMNELDIKATRLAATLDQMDDNSKRFWSDPKNVAQNVFAKEVWNAALEHAAAKFYEVGKDYSVDLVRKLKI